MSHKRTDFFGNTVTVHEFKDDDGDSIQIDVHHCGFVEMVTLDNTGCFVISNAAVLRKMATVLNEAADLIE